MKMINDTKMVVIACLTIGLAPFIPEPHIWGKIKWVLGGAEGMQLIDWGDLLMHGLPWLLLLRIGVLKLFLKGKNSKNVTSSLDSK